MKKSFLTFWLLLLFILSSAYANSNYISYSNSTQIKQATASNISNNIENFRNLSVYPYDLATTSLSWSKQVGASGGQTSGWGTSTDNSGNVYIIGYTTVGLSGQKENSCPLPNSLGCNDYFVAKYDANSNLIWSKQVGNGNTQGNGITTDNSGNVYITGSTTLGISGNTQTGNQDYFIAKYNSNGNLIWSKQVGVPYGYTYGYKIVTDSYGYVYIVGGTRGMEGISGQKQNGTWDYFIAKYDATGNLIWTKQVGAANGWTSGYGISIDSSGNIYVAGDTSVGISGQQQNGIYDYFVAKHDNNGNIIWTKQVGAKNGYTYGYGLSTDYSSNVYITGQTSVGLSGQKENSCPLPNSINCNDYFIAKYTTNGNLTWSKQVGASGGWTVGQGTATDKDGYVYTVGSTNIGISGQKQNGTWDYFIAKYDQNGLEQSTSQVGAYQGMTYGYGISLDLSGNIYVTGYTNKGISGQTQNGVYDYFIAKYIN